MTEFILENEITEQERIFVAMGAIACLLAANDSPTMQDLSVAQFVPTKYIANLLEIDIEIVRAALQNLDEAGVSKYYSGEGD